MIKIATSKSSAQARVLMVLEVDCHAQVTLTVPRETASQHAAAPALQSATALLQDHYTGEGVIGNVCNDPQNIYAPCESDNDFNGDGLQDVVAHHVAQNTWNECDLGTFTISGEITSDGACHCSGTVSDGNGGADTYDGGVGAVPFTKELWHSGCGDNAKYCGDPSYCLTWQDYQCSAVFA